MTLTKHEKRKTIHHFMLFKLKKLNDNGIKLHKNMGSKDSDATSFSTQKLTQKILNWEKAVGGERGTNEYSNCIH